MAMNTEARKAMIEYRLKILRGREEDNSKIVQKLERKLRNM